MTGPYPAAKKGAPEIRLCHIVSGDLWAGAEVQVFEVLKRLSEDGRFRIMAIVLSHGELERRLRRLSLPVHVVNQNETAFPAILLQCRRLVASFGPRIIHSHRYKENLIAEVMCLLSPDIRSVRTQHTTAFTLNPQEGKKMRFYRFLDRVTGRRFSDMVIAVSRDIGRQVGTYAGPHKTTVIHNFIDPLHIDSAMQHSPIEELGLEGRFIVGTAGRLVSVKNFTHLVEIAQIVCERHNDVRFVIVGDGPEYPALKDMIHERSLTGKVILTGFRADVYSFMKAFDLFIMTSLYEGMPMSLLEAALCGKPILAPPVGGIPEVIDARCGVLIDPLDHERTAGEIISLYHDSQRRKELGNSARMKVESGFGPEEQIDRLKGVYRSLLGPGSG